ncbi:MAG: hypothetical protein ACRC6U_09215 [Fusobacteriaceae bacterium]
MIGIPRFLNTKKDVQNLQKMTLANLVDRKEWVEKLIGFSVPAIYRFPILEKTQNYIVVPFSDRILENFTRIEVIVTGEEVETKTIKIFIENHEKDFVEITGDFLELERLGLSAEEVNKMIEEVNN